MSSADLLRGGRLDKASQHVVVEILTLALGALDHFFPPVSCHDRTVYARSTTCQAPHLPRHPKKYANSEVFMSTCECGKEVLVVKGSCPGCSGYERYGVCYPVVRCACGELKETEFETDAHVDGGWDVPQTP